jgi:GNAT superfamily N-acetyltransferase
MTEKEFSVYKILSLENYARAIAKNYKRPIDEVRIEAKKQTRQLLKDGVSTRGHHLFNVIETKRGITIGHVWLNVEKDKSRAFLYDIQVNKPYRGKGYGRETLRLNPKGTEKNGYIAIGLACFRGQSPCSELVQK